MMTRNDREPFQDDANAGDGESALHALIDLGNDLLGQLHRFRYVNPLIIDDAAREAFALSHRVLEYERYLDYLETVKGRSGRLPTRVEARVGQSIQGVFQNVQALAATALDVATELQEAGVFEQLVPELARMLDRSGPVQGTDVLAHLRPALADIWEGYGMSRPILDWALQYVDLGDMEILARG